MCIRDSFRLEHGRLQFGSRFFQQVLTLLRHLHISVFAVDRLASSVRLGPSAWQGIVNVVSEVVAALRSGEIDDVQ